MNKERKAGIDIVRTKWKRERKYVHNQIKRREENEQRGRQRRKEKSQKTDKTENKAKAIEI